MLDSRLINAIDQMLARIASSNTDWSPSAFLAYAAELTDLQCRLRGDLFGPPPPTISALTDIPAITTDVFRFADVTCFPLSEARLCFQTSGTTQHHRGRHYLARTDIYEASLLGGFETALGEARPHRLVSLVERAQTTPDSSLAHMLEVWSRTLFLGRTTFALSSDGIDLAKLDTGLEVDESVLLFTTTLGAHDLLETGFGRALPAGSIVMTTGGAKGLSGEVDSEQIERDLQSRFAAPIGSEYGMTELLSQGYRIGDNPIEMAPWCRVLAIDPDTGGACPHGQEGLLRFIDLANVQSAIAIQTGDLGVTTGPRSFTFSRRAPGVVLRGCSLTYEALRG